MATQQTVGSEHALTPFATWEVGYELSPANAGRAAALNRRYGRTLGWQSQIGRIARLIGVASPPEERTFAAAVARWQAGQGLAADGIIGPQTWARMRAALNGRPAGSAPSDPAPSVPGSSTYLKDDPRLLQVPLARPMPIAIQPGWSARRKGLAATDNRLGGLIRAISAVLGVEVPAVLAVWMIESGGRAHTPGRAIIRFENHLLFDRWGKQNQALYDRHFRFGGRDGQPGKRWEGHHYREHPDEPFRPVHTGQEGEYRALDFARRLAGDGPALGSISIGGPQILIANYAVLGYRSPGAMYEAFQAGERAQVLGFFDFCRGRHAPNRGDLIVHLRHRRWEEFARHYNGPGQVALYGAKLRDADADARQLPP